MRGWLLTCGSLYNGALEEKKSSWVRLKKGVSYNDQTRSLTLIRSQDPAFEVIPMMVLRSALKRLEPREAWCFARL